MVYERGNRSQNNLRVPVNPILPWFAEEPRFDRRDGKRREKSPHPIAWWAVKIE